MGTLCGWCWLTLNRREQSGGWAGILLTTHAFKLRVPLLAAIGTLVFLLMSWTSGSAAPAPPSCSAAASRQNALLHDGPYVRSCGPARAVVYVNGRTYRIRGGFCLPRRPVRSRTPRKRLGGISIGLTADPPAAPGLAANFWWDPPVTRAQPITIDDSEIEVPGERVAASGTVVVSKRLNGGWFSLYGRDASGPTGPLVSGSWACG
jgi:hypothetical protein